MKRIWVYLREYKRLCLLAPLFKMLEAIFELFVPLVIASVIDTGIANQDKPYIFRMCLILLVLAGIGLTCSFTAQYFSAKAAVGTSTAMRQSLFAHIQTLSFSQLDSLGSSTLITRMTSDINQVQDGVNLTLRLFLRSPFIVFGAMVMAFTIDVTAALIFLVVIVILGIIVFGIMLGTRPAYKNIQSQLDRVTSATRENLNGVRVIRAFNKEEEEIDHFHKENETLNRLQKAVGRISGLLNPMTYVVINIGIIALIYLGAFRVDSGALTQGQVVALYNYMTQILVELIKLANLIIQISRALACANRVDSIFAVEPDMQDGKERALSAKDMTGSSDIPAVAFRHVSLKYAGGGEEALTDIDFAVKRGETVGIIGGTGSGKTSLVDLIPRYYDVTEGSVLVDGQDVRSLTRASLRKKVVMVMQKARLFAGTVRDNMTWGCKEASDEEIHEALRLAQAEAFVMAKEGGLDAVIEQGGRNLSGGQRQRLTIARALVGHPDILILDDSSSALDFATDAALRRAIRNLPDHPTLFIVSQRAASLMHADRIIVLDDGRIVGIGRHEELLVSCPVYREICDSQLSERDQTGKRRA